MIGSNHKSKPDTEPPTSAIVEKASRFFNAAEPAPKETYSDIETSGVHSKFPPPTYEELRGAIIEDTKEIIKTIRDLLKTTIYIRISIYAGDVEHNPTIEKKINELNEATRTIAEICQKLGGKVSSALATNLDPPIRRRIRLVGRDSHDINNKMAVINAAILYLIEYLEYRRSKKKTHHEAYENTHEVNQDITDIIECSRSTLNHVSSIKEILFSEETLECEEINIGEIIESMCNTFFAKQAFQLDLEELKITTVRKDMECLLFNVIHNAAKFTNDNSTPIEINAAKQEDQIIVTVKNIGPKIIDEPERIFSEDYRDPNAKKFDGTGKGLSASANICYDHKSEITAENHEQGVLITIKLPANQ